MSPKAAKTPLSTASGISRTRGPGKKSQKVKEDKQVKRVYTESRSPTSRRWQNYFR